MHVESRCSSRPLRVAALIDLPRSHQSGGHVKCWERFAQAVADSDLPVDLTLFFSGEKSTEVLGKNVRIRHLPPVFSTANLKFLPYVPDHTDLAPYHPRLARELSRFDLIHTTDGFFAFARTAERISRRHRIPLVTSFHTDTPSYTEIFTRHAIERLLGKANFLSNKLIYGWQFPQKKREEMTRRLAKHVSACQRVLVTRSEDTDFAGAIISSDRVHHLRLGVDYKNFGPHRKDRSGVERDYGIPANRLVILFVGRLDVGKNIYTLIGALEKLLAQGIPLHLITAGVGPAEADLKKRLGNHVSVPGFVAPAELGRLYASADVLALSSEVEIRSMAGVEAMASGCPVLVAEKSGVAPLFNYTPAMQVVGSGIECWAEAIRKIAISPAQRQSMSEEALAYAQTHLASWKQVFQEDILSVWHQAATEQRSELSPAT